MKLRPLQDRVVVKRKDEETTSAGGIVLPGSATEKPQQGEVVAVGPGKKTNDGDIVPVDLKVGDHVVFGQYGGNTVKIDGDEFLILNENEIFGVVE
ncbi:MAG: co-chaperone GroES [Pseudomonadota bacterium]|jgi:chaperonin GroES|nr:co-chaperone GroES [Gammaproteobacteria bacterium]MAO98528.1 co-chaperone GroES [Gammaproteobacteria bacterium]MEC7858808.1 co-chaperone GroES [Pseudomonadota bacterium]MEC8097133.1 co-chaperone GroES [Pseudomonadota bacterium]|tara:strand:+ start:134 stop:421 length:288 start_codon:yes stop_codon:yes gene_type:complete